MLKQHPEREAMNTVTAGPSIQIPLSWKAVPGKEVFAWHRAPLPSDKRLIGGPKVYSWLMCKEHGEVESIYIGESGDFSKRLKSYRLRVQKPNDKDKLVEAMVKCESLGGRVELHFLDLGEGSFNLNGKLIDQLSLADHAVRLMMESIAIFMARATNLKLINDLRENAYLASILKITKGDRAAATKLIQDYLAEKGNASKIFTY